MPIRTGRLDDLSAIAAFTQDTFSWGDYVSDEFDKWLDDPEMQVFVGTDEEDRAVALVRVILMSSDEAWLASARVHPDHRRRGLGSRLNDACMRWAGEHGAVVGRLVVEEWNEHAWGQVLKLGFRPVSRWVYATRAVAAGEPDPTGNGGRRVTSERKLSVAGAVEAEAAFTAWATGELARAAHGLIPIQWTWRKMTLSDVTSSADAGELLEAQAGWAIAYERHDDPETTLWVPWVVTDEGDASRLVRGLVDHAGAAGLQSVRVMNPSVSWLDRSLSNAGYELNPMQIYEKET